MSKQDTPVSQKEFNKAVEGTVDEAISAIESGRLDTDDPAVCTLREALNDWMNNEGVDRRKAASDGQQQSDSSSSSSSSSSSNDPRGRRQSDRKD